MGGCDNEGRRGDEDRQRIVPYLDRLYGYASSLTGDSDRARDLVQSCALRALASDSPPCDEPAYRTWLFRILRNAFFDQLRKEHQGSRYRAAMEADTMGSATRNSAPLPDVFSVEKRMINALAVREGMGKLGFIHHEILVLIDVAGFAYHEAADLLQIPVGTVMSRLSRARKLLLLTLEEKAIRTPRLALVRRRK